MWGGAVAANQLEGAYDVGGKGLCIADINEYQKNIPLKQKHNGEITTQYIESALNSRNRIFPKRYGIDFYHTYKSDLKLLHELGLKIFRTMKCPFILRWLIKAGIPVNLSIFCPLLQNPVRPVS